MTDGFNVLKKGFKTGLNYFQAERQNYILFYETITLLKFVY